MKIKGIWINADFADLTHPAPEHSTVRGSPESVLSTGSGADSAEGIIESLGVCTVCVKSV